MDKRHSSPSLQPLPPPPTRHNPPRACSPASRCCGGRRCATAAAPAPAAWRSRPASSTFRWRRCPATRPRASRRSSPSGSGEGARCAVCPPPLPAPHLAIKCTSGSLHPAGNSVQSRCGSQQPTWATPHPRCNQHACVNPPVLPPPITPFSRRRWEWEELEPYVQDLRGPGQTAEALLLKYTRASQQVRAQRSAACMPHPEGGRRCCRCYVRGCCWPLLWLNVLTWFASPSPLPAAPHRPRHLFYAVTLAWQRGAAPVLRLQVEAMALLCRQGTSCIAQAPPHSCWASSLELSHRQLLWQCLMLTSKSKEEEKRWREEQVWRSVGEGGCGQAWQAGPGGWMGRATRPCRKRCKGTAVRRQCSVRPAAFCRARPALGVTGPQRRKSCGVTGPAAHPAGLPRRRPC